MRGGFFIWCFRVLIYCLGIYISFTFIVPTIGIYGAAPLAGLAIGAEILMSARMKGIPVSSEVIKRVAVADRVLGDRKQLEPGNGDDFLGSGDSKRLDQEASTRTKSSRS